MRYVRNKKTGEVRRQYCQLPKGSTKYIFLPINDLWEVVPMIVQLKDDL